MYLLDINDDRTRYLIEAALADATRLAFKARAASRRSDPLDQLQAESIGPAWQ